jgi:hypothetical protein
LGRGRQARKTPRGLSRGRHYFPRDYAPYGRRMASG